MAKEQNYLAALISAFHGCTNSFFSPVRACMPGARSVHVLVPYVTFSDWKNELLYKPDKKTLPLSATFICLEIWLANRSNNMKLLKPWVSTILNEDIIHDRSVQNTMSLLICLLICLLKKRSPLICSMAIQFKIRKIRIVLLFFQLFWALLMRGLACKRVLSSDLFEFYY